MTGRTFVKTSPFRVVRNDESVTTWTVEAISPGNYREILGTFDTEAEADTFVAGVKARGDFESTLLVDSFKERLERLGTPCGKAIVVLMNDAEFVAVEAAAAEADDGPVDLWANNVLHRHLMDVSFDYRSVIERAYSDEDS